MKFTACAQACQQHELVGGYRGLQMEAATIKTIYVPILDLFLEKLSQIMTLSLPFPQEVEESVN